MGQILNFEPAARKSPRIRLDPPQGGAAILFFTGVRYERQAGRPTASNGPREGGASKGGRPSPRTAPRRRA